MRLARKVSPPAAAVARTTTNKQLYFNFAGSTKLLNLADSLFSN